jgi:DNA ligase (NAD+)
VGEETFNMPDKCPVCGSKVVREKEHHFCTGGISCPAQLKRKLEYFASKQAMDIEGLGEKVAEQLVETGLVEKVTDLYSLEKDDLTRLERFGDKSAEKLLDQIDESRETDLASFLTALGIHHVGKETARELADNYSLKQLRKLSKEELREIEDVGPEVAENIYSFFHGKGGELVEKLLEAGVKPERRESTEELNGLKLVITGSIEGYSREELTELLENHGADVTSSVSSETDYLVVGENPGETKQEQAEKQGVEKLGEDEFKNRILSKIE